MYLEYHKMRKNTAMLQSQTFFDQKKYTENSEIVKGFFSTIEEDEKNNNKKTKHQAYIAMQFVPNPSYD